MKNIKNKKTLIICIVSGLICAVSLILYTQLIKADAEESRNSAMARYGGEQIEVCVAKRDISSGEKIDSTCYEMKYWLADLLPDNAIRNSNEIIGKQVTSPIVAGEVICEKRFQDSSVSLEVPAGLSAVSVPAKDISAVGGALSVGMRIDIYATGNTSTTLIAHNVLVLATSTSFNDSHSNTSMSWITLAVESSSVQEIVSASQTTSLYFVLPSEDSDNEDLNNSKDVDKSINSSSGASSNEEEE